MLTSLPTGPNRKHLEAQAAALRDTSGYESAAEPHSICRLRLHAHPSRPCPEGLEAWEPRFSDSPPAGFRLASTRGADEWKVLGRQKKKPALLSRLREAWAAAATAGDCGLVLGCWNFRSRGAEMHLQPPQAGAPELWLWLWLRQPQRRQVAWGGRSASRLPDRWPVEDSGAAGIPAAPATERLWIRDHTVFSCAHSALEW